MLLIIFVQSRILFAAHSANDQPVVTSWNVKMISQGKRTFYQQNYDKQTKQKSYVLCKPKNFKDKLLSAYREVNTPTYPPMGWHQPELNSKSSMKFQMQQTVNHKQEWIITRSLFITKFILIKNASGVPGKILKPYVTSISNIRPLSCIWYCTFINRYIEKYFEGGAQ